MHEIVDAIHNLHGVDYVEILRAYMAGQGGTKVIRTDRVEVALNRPISKTFERELTAALRDSGFNLETSTRASAQQMLQFRKGRRAYLVGGLRESGSKRVFIEKENRSKISHREALDYGRRINTSLSANPKYG